MLTRLTLCLTLCFCFTLPAFGQSQPPPTVTARSATLKALLNEVWEDDLKSSPEFASSVGDRRYNDQLSDLSPRAFNDALARRRDFLSRLLAIDTTGLPDQDRISTELLQAQFIADEQAALIKPWEVPINQFHGIHTDLPAMVMEAPFETVKDFDDYIVRLHKIPATLRQASENLLRGIDDHRVQPSSVVEKALVQTEELAKQTPEASPFGLPLKRFPAAISAADRKRISADLLEAIETDVEPAYLRFAKFLKVTEIPASSGQPDKPQLQIAFSDEIRHTRILELRARSQAALGSKFNFRTYNDLVMTSGIQTDVLEKRINAWIAANR